MVTASRQIARTTRWAPSSNFSASSPHHIYSPLRWSARYASTAKSRKTAVIPYGLDPMTAQSRMKVHALLSTITASNAFYAFALRIFGESLTPILHEFGLGGNNLKFEQTRAVYWPIWKCDFLARTNPSNSSPRALLECPALSLSGNSFSPISLLNFALPTLSDELPVYDAEHDLKQLGEMPIAAVPFSVDPLKAKELARKTLGRSVMLAGQKLDIDREVEELLFAAYPIYVPLYISEWSFRLTEKSKPRKITVIMTADEDKADNCFVFKPMIPGYGDKSGNYGYWIEMPRRVDDDALSGGVPTINSPRDIAKAYIDWLNPPAYDSDLTEGQDPRESSNKPPRSPLQGIDVEEDEIAWEDARIQYWSGKERVESQEWMHVTELMTKMESQLKNIKVLEEKHGNKVGFTGVVRLNKSSSDPSTKDKPFIESLGPKDAMKIIEADVKKVTAEWEEKRPSWMKEVKRESDA